jgi:hypothetical protein
MLSKIARSIALSASLALVAIVIIGESGLREHSVSASVRTPATPVSLLGALLDPEALRSLSDASPLGRLIGVSWSRAPGLDALVTERYEKGTESYRVVDWNPPHVIEERYLLDGQLPGTADLQDLRQRWTAYETNGQTVFGLELVQVPKTLWAAFLLEMELEFEREQVERGLAKVSQTIAEYAVAHPRTSLPDILAEVQVGTSSATPSSGPTSAR